MTVGTSLHDSTSSTATSQVKTIFRRAYLSLLLDSTAKNAYFHFTTPQVCSEWADIKQLRIEGSNT